MATRTRWSPGPAVWKDDLAPISAADWNYDRAAHLLAHAGFGGTPAEIQKLADAGLERAVGSLVDYENIPNPQHAAVRRIGAVGSDAEPVSREPARRDRSGPQAWRLDGRREQARGQPSGPALVGPLLLLAARHHARNAPARLLVGEPDAADDASRGREDGVAVARPLRDPREQGPRLPQDDAADRPVRKERDRQPSGPGHPGRPEPGDAVLPRRPVQRQRAPRTRTSPAR